MGAIATRSTDDWLVAAGIILGLLAAVAVPFAFASKLTARDIERCLKNQINEWANPSGWETSIYLWPKLR
jgi:hypothetical protein